MHQECFIVILITIQALILSVCTQWPVGPVYVKSYWPQKIYWLQMFFIDRNPFFAIHRITSRRMRVWPLFFFQLVIYFHALSQYSVWQTILLQESFDNHMPSVEDAGAAGRVLRTTGAYRITASYTRKYDGRTRPDTIYNYDCYNWVYNRI